jgi:DNA-binding transcriptional regulator YdaS (Cro superfamily)
MDLYQYMSLRKVQDRKFRDSYFAKELGLHRQYLSQIKNGHVKPSVDLAKRIEEKTNGQVTACELLNISNNQIKLSEALEICLPKKKLETK